MGSGKRWRSASPVVLLGLLALWAGCSGESSASSDASEDGAVRIEGQTAVVLLTADDRMQYSARDFQVRAGQQVRLVLRHVGRMPVTSMGHNVVILQGREEVADFARAVLTDGGRAENGYLPHSLLPRVVAHTSMIGGGERTAVEFVAPPPGRYPFLCTFPGHFGMMKGWMQVVP